MAYVPLLREDTEMLSHGVRTAAESEGGDEWCGQAEAVLVDGRHAHLILRALVQVLQDDAVHCPGLFYFLLKISNHDQHIYAVYILKWFGYNRCVCDD